jgi:hypothetical protein
MAFSGETAFFLGGAMGMRVFAIANAAVCLWLGRMALDKK